MKKIYRIFVAAAMSVCAAVCFSACKTLSGSDDNVEKDTLSPEMRASMTPQEIANYEALQRAKRRTLEEERVEAKREKRRKTGGTQEGSTWSWKNWKPHSVEKRERLHNMDSPVLLENRDKSIFEWRSSGPRSETLHDQQEQLRK